jgi:hypothetical protein
MPDSRGFALAWWRHRLEGGAKVALPGCGSGAWTIALALRFPASRFFGFDADPGAVADARWCASAAGVADRACFEVVAEGSFPGTGYHLVAALGGPGQRRGDDRDLLAQARHVRRTLAPDGCWMVLASSAEHHDQSRLVRLVFEGGFTRVRCAPATPTNVIIEARP